MLAVAYYAIAASPRTPPLAAVSAYMIPYLLAVVSIAAFGHLYLDAFDVEEDQLLGKENIWSPLGGTARLALLIGLLVGAALPWMFLPVSGLLVGLLALQFLMFFLYATPPIRLKQRGFPGIVADALYAHTLPSLWTWVPFAALYGSVVPPSFPILLGAWAFAVGTRHLLQHQVIQHEQDTAADTRTYAVRHGTPSTLRLLVRFLLPVESLLFIVLTLSMAKNVSFLPASFLVYVAWQTLKLRYLWNGAFALFGATSDADRATLAGTLVLSRFYERWLPLLILASLARDDAWYLLLLAVHAIVFRQGLREVRQDLALIISFVRSRRANGAGSPAAT